MQKKRDAFDEYGKELNEKILKNSVGSCNKHGKTYKEQRRTE